MGLSIISAFLRACAPHSRKTTGVCLSFSFLITASVKISQPIPLCEAGCPCRTVRNEDTKCMCREFREQIKDPDFEGYCHCMLYYKEK